jgi:hypothetical protein
MGALKPGETGKRLKRATELRVPAFTFATIRHAAALEHPSSEQKMREV